MESTYSLKAEELPDDFVDYVRGLYKGKFISITISDEDETDFLLRDADTREKLIKSTQNVETGENLVEVPIEKIKEIANQYHDFAI